MGCKDKLKDFFLKIWNLHEKTKSFNYRSEALLHYIAFPILAISFFIIWICLAFCTKVKYPWISGILGGIFSFLYISSEIREWNYETRRGKKWKRVVTRILKYPSVSFLIFLLILGSSIGLWYGVNNPPDYFGRNTTDIKLSGDTVGENNISLDFYIDYDKLYPLKSKVKSDNPEEDFPFRVNLYFVTNITITFIGLEANQIYYDDHYSVDIIPNIFGTTFEIIWYEISALDNGFVTFWLDGVITYPDARLLSLSLDISELNQFTDYGNYTINTDLELIFQHIENRDVRIESANFHFVRYYNQLSSEDFSDVTYIPWFPNPEVITNIDLDFTTTRSRLRYDTSLIFLALMVEYPIIRLGEFYQDWRDKKNNTN